MPLIKDGTLPTGDLEGQEHGATVSLILDEGEPGHGPRLHRHPYDETWVGSKGISHSRRVMNAFARVPATW
jgi:hypothetical protein